MSLRHAACLALTLAAALSLGVPPAVGADPDAQIEQRVQRILERVPLIDGHNDVPWQYRKRVDLDLDALDFASDLSDQQPTMHTDLGRLRAGGVGGQFWSVYIPIPERGGQRGDARTVIEQIDFTRRLVARYPDDMEMAYTAADVMRIHAGGRIACLLGMEGGHSIEDSLAVLRATYELGARYMTLAHGKNTRWCDSATDIEEFGGLTDFGRDVVREMNRLGMLVDLSHVSAKTMHDTLDVAEAPVIFSHSSAHAVCRHVRNVPDDVLLRVKDNGGVVMVVFLTWYVSEELREWGQARDEASRKLAELHGAGTEALKTAKTKWLDTHPRPLVTLDDVVDHIDHIRDLIGVDYIGLGGDYDGTTSLPDELRDVSTYPVLLAELLRRGYTDEEVGKIAGLNVIRALREAEIVAARLQATTEPSGAKLPPIE